MRVRRSMIVVGLVAVSGLMAVPAGAMAPETGRYAVDNFDNPDVIADACGEGVDLIGAFEVQGTYQLFVDQDGIPVKYQEHVVFNGTLTRVDTGRTLDDPGRFTVIVDLITGEETYQGLWWNMTYPGAGLVFHSVGRRIFTPDSPDEIFVAGWTDTEKGKDLFEEVCRALA